MTPEPSPNASDAALLRRYRQGDAAAFGELYARHRQGLFRFLLGLCGEQALAEEVFQETWLSLIRTDSDIRQQVQFKTWLYQIARNRLIDLLRQREGQEQGEAGESADEGASPLQSLEQKQQHAQLHAAIAALPVEQKEALVLQQFSAMSILEIAVVTGAEAETVKSRLRYAMQKLRAQLDSAAGAGGQQ